ncbi:hypothetical protein F4824DRAFT_159011 [Ustulina deusta]|nr:hypothetical protein F4824DRAFT_159011 [Ustulina deusta]
MQRYVFVTLITRYLRAAGPTMPPRCILLSFLQERFFSCDGVAELEDCEIGWNARPPKQPLSGDMIVHQRRQPSLSAQALRAYIYME